MIYTLDGAIKNIVQGDHWVRSALGSMDKIEARLAVLVEGLEPDKQDQEKCDHDFLIISEKNLGPADAAMKMNGDSQWEIISECRMCGETELRLDV